MSTRTDLPLPPPTPPPCAGTVRDAQQEFFVGGSPELEEISYLGTPTGFDAQRVLNKYGFKTEAAGEIKARVCVGAGR